VEELGRSSYQPTTFFHVIANSASLSNGAPFGANGGLRNWLFFFIFLKQVVYNYFPFTSLYDTIYKLTF